METFDVMCLLVVLLIIAALGGLVFILEATPLWDKFQNFILRMWDGPDEDD